MRSASIIAGSILLMVSGTLQAANYCGDLTNAYGPFDYTNSEHVANKLSIVESAHFTKDVEQGIKGNSSYIGGDLDYTLRAFPNHHRALAAMARIGIRDKALQLQGAQYPVECYFDRAIRFAPDDGVVHAAYGSYLFSLGKTDTALAMFRHAEVLQPENAAINYNLGLAYLKKKDYAHANTYAKKAYALGFPLPGLKNMLIEAGKWNDKAE